MIETVNRLINVSSESKNYQKIFFSSRRIYFEFTLNSLEFTMNFLEPALGVASQCAELLKSIFNSIRSDE